MEVQQELIRSNEMLSVQVWVLGGLVSFLLMVLIYFIKTSLNRVEDAIANHEDRLQTIEKNERDTIQVLKFTTQDVDEHKRLMTGLEQRVNRLFKAD